MAITSLSFNSVLMWKQLKTTDFGPITQGPSSTQFNLRGIDIDYYDAAYAGAWILSPGSSNWYQELDLRNVEDLFGDTLVFSKVAMISVKSTGGTVTLSPGTMNPLVWFVGSASSTIVVPSGGYFAYSEPASSLGTTVDISNKTIRIANTGFTTTTVDIVILGKSA